MKVGDKVKGFRFDDEVNWFEPMSVYIGVEGTVVRIFNDDNNQPYYFEVKFDIIDNFTQRSEPIYRGAVLKVFNEKTSKYETPTTECWCYPLNEYLVMIREDKLTQLLTSEV
jgi:hypothetical protein